MSDPLSELPMALLRKQAAAAPNFTTDLFEIGRLLPQIVAALDSIPGLLEGLERSRLLLTQAATLLTRPGDPAAAGWRVLSTDQVEAMRVHLVQAQHLLLAVQGQLETPSAQAQGAEVGHLSPTGLPEHP